MTTLKQIYKTLDFEHGTLLKSAARPERSRELRGAWQEKGEWLSAAKRAGAEHVFFVENDPVVIFTKIESDDLLAKVRAFNNAWCLARPRILFLETPGELTVLDLAKVPFDPNLDEKLLEKQWEKHRILLERTAQVSGELQKFHRENIESRRIYSEKFFGNWDNRADVALLRDLRTVRRTLIEQGLTTTIAHALIGRCIFVRYLEDRGILTEKDFQNVARRVEVSADVLKTKFSGDLSAHTGSFIKILQNKEFTYALFDYLAEHFNGDMFPSDNNERSQVQSKHLKTVQNMLFGNADSQKKLFFYAYNFNIIPLDLISAIYEEFYSLEEKEKGIGSQKRADGAYYTPPLLAEFVCARVLSPEVLKKKPRILDPACGSGIFLVEAFRRIVRHRIVSRPSEQIEFDELKNILKDQIAGIEVNPEAARITAFSLCLAMLHYLEPPDIRTQIYKNRKKLPCLLALESSSINLSHCILAENTFAVDKIESTMIGKKRFGEQCVDVVIGNPPWGNPGRNVPHESKSHHESLLQWAKNNGKQIGDKEASQGFIWRSLDFLKPNGICGMLVPASVLTKQSNVSQQFRLALFSQIKIREIFNFSHVRRYFFQDSDSPFLFFFYGKENPSGEGGFVHWSVKAIQQTKKIQSVIVSANDRSWVPVRLLDNQTIWKTLLYSGLADVDLINRLRNDGERFEKFVAEKGQGLIVNPPEKNAAHLAKYPLININSFLRYSNLEFEKVPSKLYRLGVETVFLGKRLLIKRGITEKNDGKGMIVARYEDASFCFTNAINGFTLKENEEQKYKVFLGIFLSSLARYFFFNTAPMWGTRNAEVHLHEILGFPIILPQTQELSDKIVQLVDRLRNFNPPVSSHVDSDITGEGINNQRYEWEMALDEAIFDSYRLNNQERDLIRDCCKITIPYFYDPIFCEGVQAISNFTENEFRDYAETFCRRWTPYLDEGTEMCWKGHAGAGGNMVAAHFFIVDKQLSQKASPRYHSWDGLLASLRKSTKYPLGTTSRLIIEGMVHILTDDGVVIVKRNEKRFWTKSKAREDAETTLYKSMMNDEVLSKKEGQ